MLTANDTVNVKNRLIRELRLRCRSEEFAGDGARATPDCGAALRLDSRGRLSLASPCYSPPTVRPSMRIVGEATLPRNSKSLPISEILQNISLRLPATVISSTG